MVGGNEHSSGDNLGCVLQKMSRDDILVYTLPAILLGLGVWLLYEGASSRSDFRVVHFFTGPEGRGSAASLCMVVGLVCGGWLLWWFAVHDKLADWMLSAFYWFTGGVGAVKVGSNAASFIGNRTMPTSNAGDSPKIRKGDDV
jgi:hypothetical protein